MARTLLARLDGPYPLDRAYIASLSADAVDVIDRRCPSRSGPACCAPGAGPGAARSLVRVEPGPRTGPGLLARKPIRCAVAVLPRCTTGLPGRRLAQPPMADMGRAGCRNVGSSMP